ncbi:MAG: hypothetical protein ACD_4C00195G0001 [uncultured bacterium (gcode 4)]|uniref:Uncharacterized protein n=1 Tax=uncultured bacterium (gcode 4) TaxID=1234023 RepID=K2FUU0_9BACT|nr:MAG: hypothetical protein ACD_4C00195G0001 [uncultured bacterium (gcode 4)]
MAEITTIASSTRSQSDRIRANIERKFKVCHARFMTPNVTKNTKGADIQATKASLIQIIRNNVRNTKRTVMLQSLIRECWSSLILSDKSNIVVKFMPFGIIQDSFIFSKAPSHSVTRFTIDPHLFLTTQSVTAFDGTLHLKESLESFVLLTGASKTLATSLNLMIQVVHVLEIMRFFKVCISKNLSSIVTVCVYLSTSRFHTGIVKLRDAIILFITSAVNEYSSSFFGSSSILYSTWSQPEILTLEIKGLLSNSFWIFFA